jgi:type II secretory pathway pseudopilin PulG
MQCHWRGAIVAPQGRATSRSPRRFALVAQLFTLRTTGSQVGNLRHLSGFTVLELLIVISIIIALAGLILATSGYVRKKGARSRTEAEIAALSAALENYKADNGIYPTESTKTETLDPGAAVNLAAYEAASLFLYEQLSGDGNNDRQPDANVKTYFAFKPNMLSPRDPASNVGAIIDPFGNSYGYSTKKANPAGTSGYNPTYDLWSTGGLTTGTDQSQWIKNW